MEVTLDKKLELIGKIDFFCRFTEADRITMANMATFQGYAPTEKLIQQNTSNTQLFFIINGTVDIVIDGKLIVSLAGGGHVFGEMSFVDYSPTSASVVANSKVVAMLFDTTKINLIIEPAFYKLRMDIYRSCAEILARRLIQTNSITQAYIQREKLGDLL